MDEITLKALAKINLGLDVIRRREDGYHEVSMVMQTIHLYDRLEIAKSHEPGIHIRSNLNFLPVNENNLVYKAGKLLMDEFGITDGVDVNLEKRIPVAAGMAGGSTDAASMLYGMNRIFDLGLSRRQLMERGVQIGADVPYCIMAKTALSEGIGEVLTEVAPLPDCFVVVAKPTISVSTKMVYENLHANELQHHPDVVGMVDALKQGDLSGVASRMENVLETVTTKLYPQIEEIKQTMKESGAENAIMSGSGPTVFGLYTEKATAEQAAEKIRQQYGLSEVYVTQPC